MGKISVLKSVLLAAMAAGGALLTAAVSFIDIGKKEEALPAAPPEPKEDKTTESESEETETEETE